VGNARFEVADVYQLPFPDASFDAAFAHIVLMHIREPLRALKEMRRVLRPGGIVGIRDPDNGGRILAPAIPILEQWYELALKIRQHNGGNPYMARNHRRLLLDAGFARAEATVSVWSAGTLEGTRRRAVFLKAQVKGLSPTGLREGWIDESMVERVLAEIDAWAERPDALHFETFCETIGWVGDNADEVLR
jgi:SAM-dependent methyltransferase